MRFDVVVRLSSPFVPHPLPQPIAILFDAVVLQKPAAHPMNVLLDPVVL